MSDQTKLITDKMLPIFKRNGVVRAALFGSYAREEQKKDSDIDLLTVLPEKSSLLDFIGLKQELEECLGKRVDLVTPGGISKRLKPYIDRDLVQIYG